MEDETSAGVAWISGLKVLQLGVVNSLAFRTQRKLGIVLPGALRGHA